MTPAELRTKAAAVLFRDWGTKALALVLTVVLFVVTRNEVTRGFRVPLEATPDPQRVLMTELPTAIRVEVRGPWARVNRLHDYDLAPVQLDLRKAEPGPLEIDPASVVMPPGVVMANMEYAPVDLRFEPVIERRVPVDPVIVGEPDHDYEVVRVEVEPRQWIATGGQSAVHGLGALATTPLDIGGLDHSVVRNLALRTPPEGVSLAEESGASVPQVRVRVVVEPIEGERELQVPIVNAKDYPGIPLSYPVRVSGSRRALRRLSDPSDTMPVAGTVLESQKGGLELRFDFAPELKPLVASSLALEPSVVRLEQRKKP